MRIDDASVPKALRQLNELLTLNDQELGEFEYNEEYGYLTANPLNAGNGVEIVYSLSLENSNSIAESEDIG